MQTVIEGSEEINATVSKLKGFLSDTANIAKCIPDSKDFKKINDSNFSISIEAGISMVRGTFKLIGTVQNSGNDYLYKLSGKGLGSEVNVSISVSLAENGPSTSVKWKTEASFTGIVSGVSEPIIKNITNQKVAQIVENLKRELSSV
ncbi:SRPBCC domain-containing protein [Candidatus Marsarchaeota archaeon]|nr:SRPBCC domain-containing protein [Candidatus Marsarchaeota archaeon]